ncbi:MAG TPA: hypothetical protein VGJ78_14905 [Vicinamibacterales bacterium]|jgi:hypothetical protein
MKRSFTFVVSAAIVAALSASLSAQWPLHPNAGVPKGRDGKPNLSAPAPRTADGKPDLSGIWMRTNRTEAPGTAPAGQPPLATFGNIGANVKDGLPYQAWVADLLKKRSNAYENPDALCLPQGPLEYHLDPQPREIIQLPQKIVIVYESNYGIRTIYTDGRALPKQGEPQPYWHGYSVGRWDGDTLVVTSNNFRGAQTGLPGDGWLDGKGDPFTDALTLTERFRRVNYGNLQIDVTIDDPKAYTRPFTVRVEQEIVADGSEMIEFICHENQKFLKLTGREN